MGTTLTDAQKQQVSAWIEQGLKLSEIQTRLDKELGVRMTYMEVRFLIDDLKLKPKDQEPPPPPPAPLAPKAAEPGPVAPPPDEGWEESGAEPPPPAPGAANVKVSVDQIARPGAMISGKVTFSDGQQAEWYLDQTGRLGLVSKTPGYRPPESDVAMFQAQLHAALQRAGF